MKTLLGALALMLILSLAVMAHETAEAPHGAPKALLQKALPSAQGFVPRQLALSPAARARVEKALKTKLEGHDLTASVYVGTRGGRSAGMAWMTDVHLSGGNADVVVGVDLQGRVTGVALGHSPTPALAQASFLAQFKGKTAASPLTVGRDLKAAPGQSAASQKLAAAVRKAVLILTEKLKAGAG